MKKIISSIKYDKETGLRLTKDKALISEADLSQQAAILTRLSLRLSFYLEGSLDVFEEPFTFLMLFCSEKPSFGHFKVDPWVEAIVQMHNQPRLLKILQDQVPFKTFSDAIKTLKPEQRRRICVLDATVDLFKFRHCILNIDPGFKFLSYVGRFVPSYMFLHDFESFQVLSAAFKSELLSLSKQLPVDRQFILKTIENKVKIIEILLKKNAKKRSIITVAPFEDKQRVGQDLTQFYKERSRFYTLLATLPLVDFDNLLLTFGAEGHQQKTGEDSTHIIQSIIYHNSPISFGSQ